MTGKAQKVELVQHIFVVKIMYHMGLGIHNYVLYFVQQTINATKYWEHLVVEMHWMVDNEKCKSANIDKPSFLIA